MGYERREDKHGRVPGSLPEFEVVEQGDGLLVTCKGKKRCGRSHGVTKDWLDCGRLGTRPCPYCFATSRVPELTPSGQVDTVPA